MKTLAAGILFRELSLAIWGHWNSTAPPSSSSAHHPQLSSTPRRSCLPGEIWVLSIEVFITVLLAASLTPNSRASVLTYLKLLPLCFLWVTNIMWNDGNLWSFQLQLLSIHCL